MYDDFDYDDSLRFDEMMCADDYNRFEEREVFRDQLAEDPQDDFPDEVDCESGEHLWGPVDRYCGVKICYECGHHKGLTRCYCGWSEARDGYGRQELVDMGETIDPEVW